MYVVLAYAEFFPEFLPLEMFSLLLCRDMDQLKQQALQFDCFIKVFPKSGMLDLTLIFQESLLNPRELVNHTLIFCR